MEISIKFLILNIMGNTCRSACSNHAETGEILSRHEEEAAKEAQGSKNSIELPSESGEEI